MAQRMAGALRRGAGHRVPRSPLLSHLPRLGAMPPQQAITAGTRLTAECVKVRHSLIQNNLRCRTYVAEAFTRTNKLWGEEQRKHQAAVSERKQEFTNTCVSRVAAIRGVFGQVSGALGSATSVLEAGGAAFTPGDARLLAEELQNFYEPLHCAAKDACYAGSLNSAALREQAHSTLASARFMVARLTSTAPALGARTGVHTRAVRKLRPRAHKLTLARDHRWR